MIKLTRNSFIYIAPFLATLSYFLLLNLGTPEKTAIAAAISILTVIW